MKGKRGSELKFLGSIEDHEGYNISEKQPDPMKAVGLTTILAQNSPKKAILAPKTGPTPQTITPRTQNMYISIRGDIQLYIRVNGRGKPYFRYAVGPNNLKKRSKTAQNQFLGEK